MWAGDVAQLVECACLTCTRPWHPVLSRTHTKSFVAQKIKQVTYILILEYIKFKQEVLEVAITYFCIAVIYICMAYDGYLILSHSNPLK